MQLLNHGAMMAIVLLAGMLALVLGFALLTVYKRTLAPYAKRGRHRQCGRSRQLLAANAALSADLQRRTFGRKTRRIARRTGIIRLHFSVRCDLLSSGFDLRDRRYLPAIRLFGYRVPPAPRGVRSLGLRLADCSYAEPALESRPS